MDWISISSSTLILFGAFLMLINIFSHRLMLRAASKHSDEQTGQTKILIWSHMAFMVFFFLGYLGVLALFLKRVDFSSSLFVAIIFFFGAIFVFMGIAIQRRLFASLRSKNQKLAAYNSQLKREQTNLIELNQRLESEIEDRMKAQEADKMKSDFLSLVSHELRTPLTSIYGFTKLIKKEIASIRHNDVDETSLAKKRKRLDGNLNIISDECGRLTRLINNVLDLARIESGRITWNDRPVALRDVIGTAVAAVEGLFMEKPSVAFELDLSDDLPKVMLDTDLFTQVLINLINNAVKFTDSGVIVLNASIKDKQIKIAISDNGHGIAEENLDNIFDKFYIIREGDTLGCRQMGTGLGLPICRQIVEHYDGRIWAESEQKKGSTFYIVLPEEIIVSN